MVQHANRDPPGPCWTSARSRRFSLPIIRQSPHRGLLHMEATTRNQAISEVIQTASQRFETVRASPPSLIAFKRRIQDGTILAEPQRSDNDELIAEYLDQLRSTSEGEDKVICPYESGPAPTDAIKAMRALRDLTVVWSTQIQALRDNAIKHHKGYAETLESQNSLSQEALMSEIRANFDVMSRMTRFVSFRESILEEANRLLWMAESHAAEASVGQLTEAHDTQARTRLGVEMRVARTLGSQISELADIGELEGLADLRPSSCIDHEVRLKAMMPLVQSAVGDRSSSSAKILVPSLRYTVDSSGNAHLTYGMWYRVREIHHLNTPYVTEEVPFRKVDEEYSPDCNDFLAIDTERGVLKGHVEAVESLYKRFDARRKELLHRCRSARESDETAKINLALCEIRLGQSYGQHLSDSVVKLIPQYSEKAQSVFADIDRESGDFSEQERFAYWAIRSRFFANHGKDKADLLTLAANLTSYDPDFVEASPLIKKAKRARVDAKKNEEKSHHWWSLAASFQANSDIGVPRSISELRVAVEERKVVGADLDGLKAKSDDLQALEANGGISSPEERANGVSAPVVDESTQCPVALTDSVLGQDTLVNGESALTLSRLSDDSPRPKGHTQRPVKHEPHASSSALDLSKSETIEEHSILGTGPDTDFDDPRSVAPRGNNDDAVNDSCLEQGHTKEPDGVDFVHEPRPQAVASEQRVGDWGDERNLAFSHATTPEPLKSIKTRLRSAKIRSGAHLTFRVSPPSTKHLEGMRMGFNTDNESDAWPMPKEAVAEAADANATIGSTVGSDSSTAPQCPINALSDTEFVRLHTAFLTGTSTGPGIPFHENNAGGKASTFSPDDLSYIEHMGGIIPLPPTAEGEAQIASVYINKAVYRRRPSPDSLSSSTGSDRTSRLRWAEAPVFTPR